MSFPFAASQCGLADIVGIDEVPAINDCAVPAAPPGITDCNDIATPIPGLNALAGPPGLGAAGGLPGPVGPPGAPGRPGADGTSLTMACFPYAPLPRFGNVMADLYTWDGFEWVPSGMTAIVFDSAGIGPVKQNCCAVTAYSPAPGSQRFELVSPGCCNGVDLVRFRLTETLELGGFAEAVIQVWNAGTEEYEDGDTIVVNDFFGDVGGPGEWQAPNGYYGFAVRLADLDEYQIVYMEHQAAFIAFTLTAAMSGGSAAATFNSFWMGRSTGGATAVYDRQNLYSTAQSGAKGIACWDSKLEEYVIIDMNKSVTDIVRFRLTGTLVLGLSAPAVIRRYDSGTNSYVDGDTITVNDYFGALGDPGEWQAPSDYYGFAVRLSDFDEYQILYMEHQAEFVAFYMTSNMAGGFANANFESFWMGRGTASETSVYDRQGLYASARVGDRGIACWDSKLGQYVIIDMGKGSATELTLFYLNDSLDRGSSAPATIRLWEFGNWTTTGANIEVFDSSNLGPADRSTVGVAFLSSQSGRYEIIALPGNGGAQIVRFKLYDDLELGGSAAAKIQVWDAGSDAYVDGGDITVVDFYGALGRRGKWQGPSGYYGFAVKIPDKNEYHILDMERIALFASVTITSAMAGGSATAIFTGGSNRFWQGQSVAGANRVYDPLNLYDGAQSGQEFIVCWDDFAEQYKIIEGLPTHQAIFVEGYLNENMGASIANAAAAAISDYYQGTNPGPATIVRDTLQIYGNLQAGDKYIAAYDDRDNQYHIIDARQQGATRWAVTQGDIVLDSESQSDEHYSMAQECEDSEGNNPSGSTFRLYFHSASSATDPNVRDGAIMPFVVDKLGFAVSLNDSLDDCRGTIKIWYSDTGSIPAGWALCDGSTYGGRTTPDLRGKFVLGAQPGGSQPFDDQGNSNAPGETGGNKKHKHEPHKNYYTSYTSLYVNTTVRNPLYKLVVEPTLLGGYTQEGDTGFPEPDNFKVKLPPIKTEIAPFTVTAKLDLPSQKVWSFLNKADPVCVVGPDLIHLDGGGTACPDFEVDVPCEVDPNPPTATSSYDGEAKGTYPHTHSVPPLKLDIAPNPHTHNLNIETIDPGYVQSILIPNPHNHQIPEMDHSEAYNVPPYYALCYIMRVQ